MGNEDIAGRDLSISGSEDEECEYLDAKSDRSDCDESFEEETTTSEYDSEEELNTSEDDSE